MGSEAPKRNLNMKNHIKDIVADDKLSVGNIGAGHGSNNDGKDLPSTHCLICDVVLSNLVENFYNIFGQLRKAGDSCARGSVFEKMGQVLNRSLHSIKLHSEVVCNNCFNLLFEHEEVKCRLLELQSEVEAKFNVTAEHHAEESQSSKGILQSCEKKSYIKESESTIDAGKSATECIRGKSKNVKKDGEEDVLIGRDQSDEKIKKSRKFHKLNKPYICSICGKTFRAFSHRVEHMLIHLDEKPWSCKECHKSFRTKSALRVHETKHSGIRPYTCQHCNKSFLDRYYFEEHLRIHSGERPFACAFCSRLFARKKDLTIHTKCHTGDKPYKCSSCTKTFAVKSRLDRHLKIHSGERPYCCEHCPKSFSRRDDYQVHLRTHTGERPFRCAVCDRTFTNKSNCLVHVRLHQSSKHRYQCLVCKKNFKKKTSIDEHMKTHHLGKSESTKADSLLRDNILASQSPAIYIQSLDHAVATEGNLVDQPSFTQPLLQLEPVQQNVTVTHIPPIQSLPVTQVAQLDWGELSAAATTTFVNITPGTYVSII